ncbi:hypothetical protein H920_12499 [Fukomys damarensis]|uniref:Uncharacterized protein n=1 Tax=Fukomys damarensis TaxID=885580 RepID=A0A091D6H6_FUKDA|nr:hypothetical protein H920_12499 [Fukomys damarensis]
MGLRPLGESQISTIIVVSPFNTDCRVGFVCLSVVKVSLLLLKGELQPVRPEFHTRCESCCGPVLQRAVGNSRRQPQPKDAVMDGWRFWIKSSRSTLSPGRRVFTGQVQQLARSETQHQAPSRAQNGEGLEDRTQDCAAAEEHTQGSLLPGVSPSNARSGFEGRNKKKTQRSWRRRERREEEERKRRRERKELTVQETNGL